MTQMAAALAVIMALRMGALWMGALCTGALWLGALRMGALWMGALRIRAAVSLSRASAPCRSHHLSPALPGHPNPFLSERAMLSLGERHPSPPFLSRIAEARPRKPLLRVAFHVSPD